MKLTQESGETNVREKEVAHTCSMTVLTEPDPFIYRDGAIGAALSRTFPELAAKNNGDGLRYDLLSVPGLKYLPKNKDLEKQLVEDIFAALSLHKVEHLLVVTADHTHTPIVQRLKDHPGLRKALRTIRGYTAKARLAATPLRTLAVPCMDWRKHDSGGFLTQFSAAYGGSDTLGVMTVPGVGKELQAGSSRGKLVVGLLGPLVRKGLSRIVLVAHTDCGKYGGSKSFPGSEEESARLSADMASAAAFIRSFHDVKVDCGIAYIKGRRVARIEPVAP